MAKNASKKELKQGLLAADGAAEGFEKKPRERPSDKGLTSARAKELLLKFGKNELPEKKSTKYQLLMDQFLAPMPLMITAAFIIEGLLGDYVDMYLLITLNIVNGGIAFYEASNAADAIAALKSSLKPRCQAKRDGKWVNFDAKELVPGDVVALNAGAAVPADCEIISGHLEVDQAALTGESLPVAMVGGDEAKMGSTAVRGEVSAIVKNTGANTFFGKTATLIAAASGEKSNMEKVLLTIMISLCIISFVLCTTSFVFLMEDRGDKFETSLSFSVVLLVASIPMAMEVVTTTVMALGSRELAAMGAIVARLASIEEMAGMNMLCSDKTGTLTLNKMELQVECPTYDNECGCNDQAGVIKYAALAAKWWEPAKDALDTLVLNSCDKDELNANWESVEDDFMPFDPSKKRTSARVKSKDGKQDFFVTKGAPHIILDMCHNKAAIEDSFNHDVHAFAERGVRCLAVAKEEAAGWEMLGILTFLDPPRPDTKRTLDMAKEYGIHIKMITGDHMLIGKEMMRMLGQGTNMLSADELPVVGSDGKVDEGLFNRYQQVIVEADGFGEVFPEHKYFIVELLRHRGYRVGMTGDGVNDAPALKRADIGVAVQGATDAARAAADIVLTKPGLFVMVDSIVIARTIFQRMKNYLVYRVACTIQLLLFFFIALVAFNPQTYCSGNNCDFYSDDDGTTLPNFFYLPVLALIVITILNDGTLITVAYDNVKPGKLPEVWNLRMLYLVSTVLGMVAVISSLLLLHLGLESVGNDNGWLSKMFGKQMSFEEVQSMIYLKVSISDFLTLFAARTNRMFWEVKPAPKLLGAAMFALGMSSILALTWNFDIGQENDKNGMEPITFLCLCFTWSYCLAWFLLQDFLKMQIYIHIVDKDKLRAEQEFAFNSPKAKGGLATAVEVYDTDGRV